MNNKISTQWGIITGLAMILLQLTGTVLNLETNKVLSTLVYVVFFGGVYMSCKLFSKENNAQVTFGEVFGNGFKTVAGATLINIAYLLLSLVLFPSIKQKAIEAMYAQFEKNKTPQDMIDKIMPTMEKYFNLTVSASLLFALLLFGLIFALIAAAIVPKKQKDFSTFN